MKRISFIVRAPNSNERIPGLIMLPVKLKKKAKKNPKKTKQT